MLRLRRPKGFSMIELLTVIFIIAFMISLLAWAMLKYMNTAKIRATRAQLQRLTIALNAYYNDLHQYPPDTGYGLKPDSDPVYPQNWQSTPPTRGTQVLYDPGTLYRYLGKSVHWIKKDTNGNSVDKGFFGPYLKFDTWELRSYKDAVNGDSYVIVDPWGTPIGYIGDPARKIHNRDSVDVFSAGPDKKTASDDTGFDHRWPAGYQHDNQAYDGTDNDGDGVIDNATELGYAILNGALTQFKKDKNIGNSDSTKNERLDDINNWDPEN